MTLSHADSTATLTAQQKASIFRIALEKYAPRVGPQHFTVTDENGGRIKSLASKRDVPFAEELIPLHLPAYVEALRASNVL
jgi:hypothetical protein